MGEKLYYPLFVVREQEFVTKRGDTEISREMKKVGDVFGKKVVGIIYVFDDLEYVMDKFSDYPINVMEITSKNAAVKMDDSGNKRD